MRLSPSSRRVSKLTTNEKENTKREGADDSLTGLHPMYRSFALWEGDGAPKTQSLIEKAKRGNRKRRSDELASFCEQSKSEKGGSSSDEAGGNLMPGNERGRKVDTRRSRIVRVGFGETHHEHWPRAK